MPAVLVSLEVGDVDVVVAAFVCGMEVLAWDAIGGVSGDHSSTDFPGSEGTDVDNRPGNASILINDKLLNDADEFVRRVE